MATSKQQIPGYVANDGRELFYFAARPGDTLESVEDAAFNASVDIPGPTSKVP